MLQGIQVRVDERLIDQCQPKLIPGGLKHRDFPKHNWIRAPAAQMCSGNSRRLQSSGLESLRLPLGLVNLLLQVRNMSLALRSNVRMPYDRFVAMLQLLSSVTVGDKDHPHNNLEQPK